MPTFEQNITSFFGEVNSDELNILRSLFEEEVIAKGDFLVKEGQQCYDLGFVQEGIFRIFKQADEKEITQWISTPGNFTTELSSFIFHSPSRWSIQAITDTKIITIKRSNYEKLNQLIPKWIELEKLFLVKCFTFLEDRIYSHLSMTAEERYQFFYNTNKEFFNQVPQQYIASMLGMTPETYSRIRKKQLE